MKAIWKASLGIGLASVATWFWLDHESTVVDHASPRVASSQQSASLSLPAHASMPDETDEENWAQLQSVPGDQVTHGVRAITPNNALAIAGAPIDDGYREGAEREDGDSGADTMRSISSPNYDGADDTLGAAEEENVAYQEDLVAYEDALREAYQEAKQSGDQEFLTLVMGQMRELNTLKRENSNEVVRGLRSESRSDTATAVDVPVVASVEPPVDPEIAIDCQRDLTMFGEFQCPCPSDDLYNPRWREAFNPAFLEDKQCPY